MEGSSCTQSGVREEDTPPGEEGEAAQGSDPRRQEQGALLRGAWPGHPGGHPS